MKIYGGIQIKESDFSFIFRKKIYHYYGNKYFEKGNDIKMKVVFLNEDGTKPNIKERFKQKMRDAKEWASANKETLIILTPVIIGGATTVVKVTGKRMNLRKEESLKNLYCYDRSLGHYWRLKRKLSNAEWLEIDARKNKGESLSNILASFKVLK